MSAIPPAPTVDTGYLLKSGSPAIKVKVWGVFAGAAKEFEAIIDTGFTGFLSMPLLEALPLGLVLATTTKVTLADGTSDIKLLALGSAALPSGQVERGAIILEPNPSDVLLGMDFLDKFQRTLLLFGQRALPVPIQATAQPVLLLDNKTVQGFLDTAYRTAQAQATQTAAVAPAAPSQPVSPPTPQANPGSETAPLPAPPN